MGWRDRDKIIHSHFNKLHNKNSSKEKKKNWSYGGQAVAAIVWLHIIFLYIHYYFILFYFHLRVKFCWLLIEQYWNGTKKTVCNQLVSTIPPKYIYIYICTMLQISIFKKLTLHAYICLCVCVCVCIYIHIYEIWITSIYRFCNFL